jgi:hypothetical protein
MPCPPSPTNSSPGLQAYTVLLPGCCTTLPLRLTLSSVFPPRHRCWLFLAIRSEDARNLQQAAAAVGPLFSGADDDEAEGDASCSICMDRAPEAILLECGHGGLCMPCADSLWEQGPEGRLCPMCRKPITGIVKIVSENGSDVTVEVMHYSLAPSVETPADTGPRLFRRFLSGHGRNASAASQAISQEGTSGANVSPQVIFEVRNIEAPAPVGQEQQSSQERGASN